VNIPLSGVKPEPVHALHFFLNNAYKTIYRYLPTQYGMKMPLCPDPFSCS
jgi:hypothetical protein